MKIYVVFFGGYLADQLAINQWLASATTQRNDIAFDAYPYPDGVDWKRPHAVAGFEKKFDGAIKKIKDSHADKIYIVGHSSACAIADELNSRIEGDHKNITLSDLDGFAPRPEQIKGATVNAWSAEGPGGKGQSVNWDADHIIYHAAHATQPWSLHFSLVNTAATDAITADNYDKKGYAGCIANLAFLC